MAVSLCACGNPAKKGSDTGNNAQTIIGGANQTTAASKQIIAPITEVYGEYDNLKELSGSFIESIDGVETNYIFINSLGNTSIGVDSYSPMPIGIETSEDGLMVYRGSKTPGDTFHPYTFDGTTLKFEIDGVAYEWKKVEQVDIDSVYNLIVDDKLSEVWVFEDGNLTIQKDGNETTATYVQTADKLTVTMADGTSKEYNYVFDRFSLELSDGSGKLFFRCVV